MFHVKQTQDKAKAKAEVIPLVKIQRGTFRFRQLIPYTDRERVAEGASCPTTPGPFCVSAIKAWH